jgi:hypothetical protein
MRERFIVGTKAKRIKLIGLKLNNVPIIADTMTFVRDRDSNRITLSSFDMTPEIQAIIDKFLHTDLVEFSATAEYHALIEGVCSVQEHFSYDNPSAPSGKSHNMTLSVANISYSETSAIKAVKITTVVAPTKPKKEEFMELTLNTDYENKVAIRKEHVDYYLESKTSGTNIYLMGRERHVWVKEDYKTVAGLMKE